MAPRVKPEVEDDGAGLDIRALLRFFLRRMWIMVSVGGLLAAAFIGYTMLQTPKYTGVALIMISPDRGDIVNDTPASTEAAPDVGTLESQIEILQSRKIAQMLVDRLKLVEDPAWNPALRKAGPVNRALSFVTGSKAAPPTKLDQFKTREAITDAVAGSIYARRRGVTYVIEVAATSPNAAQAAKMANGVVALYLESQLRARYDAAQKANNWLGGRLSSLKAEVQQKEAGVEAYRAQSGLLVASGASLTEQQVTGLQGAVLGAKTDIAEKMARYQQVQSIIRQGGSADSVAAVINSETIRALRAQESDVVRRQADLEQRYGELHPSIAAARVERNGIQQQIQAEVLRISANLRNEVEVAQARLATLVGNQELVQGEMVENNAGMVKLRELERDAGATRAIYESFLRRYQEISESVSLEVTNAHSVGEATVPTRKSSPRLGIALLLGVALGAIAGFVAGLIVEFMDEGLDDAAAVEAETGAPVLASIPVVRPENRNKETQEVTLKTLVDDAVKIASWRDLTELAGHASGLAKRGVARLLGRAKDEPSDASKSAGSEAGEWNPGMYLVERPMSAFAEGFRSLRTSLLYSKMDQRIKIVAVTSAMPGEGKTTTSVCLARVAGLSGQRVVAVDCDLRRRSLSTLLGVNVKSGLLQVLNGKATWQSAITKDAATGIDILPTSEDSFTPWDVFGSSAMQNLLNELADNYDLILLDCPPVLAVAETRIICSLAHTTVLVVRWAHTPARAAYGAIEQIEQCGGLVGGIAINRVDPNAPGRGAYGNVTYQARHAGDYYHD